jgi:hypothetical protein
MIAATMMAKVASLALELAKVENLQQPAENPERNHLQPAENRRFLAQLMVVLRWVQPPSVMAVQRRRQ